MKTDELIELLSSDIEPVDHRRSIRTIGAAVALAAAAALIIVFAVLGPRADLITMAKLVAALVKIAITATILVPASLYLIRLARPGAEQRISTGLVALPFAAVMLLAALSVTLAPNYHWSGAILSDEWLECVISIPLIAVVPFAVITWVVRQMAPTDLAGTGALVGLVAGCISAIGYAFHCADDSVPFFALWYTGTIALCTLAGWRLGPRLLRW